MPEAVRGLGQVFTDKAWGSVAIVTCRNCAVAGFGPTAEMILHHVAIGAGLRVISKIGGALSVNKGVDTDTYRKSDNKEEKRYCGPDTKEHRGRGLIQSTLPQKRCLRVNESV